MAVGARGTYAAANAPGTSTTAGSGGIHATARARGTYAAASAPGTSTTAGSGGIHATAGARGTYATATVPAGGPGEFATATVPAGGPGKFATATAPAGGLDRLSTSGSSGGGPGNREDEEQRKKRRWLILLLLLLLFGGGSTCAYAVWHFAHISDTAGMRVVTDFDRDAQDMQALIDREVEKSRITVSLFPTPKLDSETGALGLNFIVQQGNNGFSERFEIEQDGRRIFRSGVVEPGWSLPEVQVEGAHAGPATVTVYAVDQKGDDHGNPVSVEIEITA